jgi:uncharacterized membrane protein
MLATFIEHYLPTVIYLLEFMGIVVIVVTSTKAFLIYIKGILSRHVEDDQIKTDFAKGLGMALEFLLSAEVLKTIIIHTKDELLVLGIIMGLRIIVALLPQLMHSGSHKETTIFKKSA